jgi:surface polysaccharide O-acyltransferase-like enzyme
MATASTSELKHTLFVSSDAMRALAAFVVCIVHMTSPTIHFESTVHSGFNWWNLLLFESMGKWAVPVFLMLSGALLLDPSKQESVETFYRKRMSKLLVPLLFWSAFYILVSHFKSAANPSALASFGKFLAGEPFYHLYYLFIAMGLYVFTPALRLFYASAAPRIRFSFAVLCLFLATLSNSLGNVSEFFNFSAKPTQHALNMFVPFIGYFLIGYELSVIPLEKLQKFKAAIVSVFLLSWIGTAVLFHVYTQAGGTFLGVAMASNYISANVIVMSIFVFLSMRLLFESDSYRNLPEQNIIKRSLNSISKYSFGIYLCHPVFIAAVRFRFIEPMRIEPYTLSIPAFALIFFVLGYVSTFVLSKIPYLRRVV